MKAQENVGKLDNSPVSRNILEHFSAKLCPQIAWIILLKCLAIVSCKLDWPRLSVLHVAPTRMFKSLTSHLAMSLFDDEFWIDLKSDFTMNSLRRYKTELECGKCFLVNDGTTLLASKAHRTKDRLVGGLSELLSDGSYMYQDFGQHFTLKGNVTMVLNITSEAYQNYKDRLFGLTFSERFLTIHYVLTQLEKEEWVAKEEEIQKINSSHKITVDDIEVNVEIPTGYLRNIQHLAKGFSYDSLTSSMACQDLIKALLRAHAAFNHRGEVCFDDLVVVLRARNFLRNPFSPFEGQIVRLRAKGQSINEICCAIGKGNYEQQVQRVIRKAELRGILSPPDSHTARLTSTTRKGGEANGQHTKL